MNTMKKVLAAGMMAALSSAAFAGISRTDLPEFANAASPGQSALTSEPTAAVQCGVTRASAEQAALAAHPGTVTLAKREMLDNKALWEVKVRSRDGSRYLMFFDAETGAEALL